MRVAHGLLAALPFGVAIMLGPPGWPAAADQPVAQSWALDRAESRLAFVLHEGGHDIEGVFERFEADIDLSPDAPETARISVTVDVTSFLTGVADYDDAVGLPGWMDFARYPTATFVADNIVAVAGGAFEAHGDLTIRGRTQAVVLPFSFAVEGDRAVSEGGLTVNRRDFLIGDGSWETRASIGNAVDVHFTIHLDRLY